MSYKVNVLSEPILAKTEDSARLNFMAEIVSVDVGNVKFEIGALLQWAVNHYGKNIESTSTHFVSSQI